jgi:hypothetical protein
MVNREGDLYCRQCIDDKDGIVDVVVRPLQEFSKDSVHIIKRCHKPA